MLKQIVCCLILAVPGCLYTVQAQTEVRSAVAEVLYDGNGSRIESRTSDIAGTPFLKEEWRLGSVTLQSNRRFDSVKIRLNIETQQVHFMDVHNEEIALFKGYVKMIRFYDVLPEMDGPAEFQTGFPAVDQQDEKSFYQVICRGKVFLLKYKHKAVSQYKNQFSGENQREYVSYEDYYVSNGREITRIKKDKSAVLSLLADQQAKVQSFIDTNHLKLKSVDEVKRVIDYYNAL